MTRRRGLTLLSSALEKHPKHPAIEYDRAVILERAGRVKESVEVLERLLQERPDDPVLMNALGYTLADHNMDLSRADGLIHKALLLTPDSPAVLDSLGWVRYREGDAKGAVPQLEHAYSLEHDADIAAHWGEVLWASGTAPGCTSCLGGCDCAGAGCAVVEGNDGAVPQRCFVSFFGRRLL